MLLNPGIDCDRVERPAVGHLKTNAPGVHDHARSEHPPSRIPGSQVGIPQHSAAIAPELNVLADQCRLQAAADRQFDLERPPLRVLRPLAQGEPLFQALRCVDIPFGQRSAAVFNARSRGVNGIGRGSLQTLAVAVGCQAQSEAALRMLHRQAVVVELGLQLVLRVF